MPTDMKSMKGNNFVWTNIDTLTMEALTPLLDAYPFHSLDIEDCLSRTQLPKIEEYSEYLFIILHFPRFLKEKKFSIPVQVSIFIGRDFLITVHNGELKAINKLFSQCNADDRIRSDYMGKSPSFLLYKILSAIVENLMLMMGKVIFNLDELEDRVFDEKVDAAREVTELRHNIANLRRIVFPFKRVLHELEKKIERLANEDMGMYFSDLADYIDKAWAILEECKETIEIYKDTDFIISSDRTNKILALLTIVFTFSIPVTVVGTFFSMNINMPGTINNPWTFWGPYTTFIIVLATSIIPVIFMYIAFKKKRWL
jgi:magnesium transporter